MTEVLFTFDQRNYRFCQNTYRGAEQQEFYRGDYTIEAGSVIDVRADRRRVGPYSIIRIRSKSPMTFRRSWSHIREDGIDVAVLWFVKSGGLTVTHSTGRTIATAGDFVITKSQTPFLTECHVGEDSSYETLQIVVPNHALRRFSLNEATCGFRIPAKGRDFAIAEHILRDLFDDGGEVSNQIAERLVGCTLEVLSQAIQERQTIAAEIPPSISQQHLEHVLKFIEVHLSDQHLNSATIAEGCRISPRYLFFVLSQYGYSLSALVWKKRMEIAREWLSTTTPEEVPVSEIAYRVGFKNPQHFSRKFKRTFNMSPRDCRTGAQGGPLKTSDRRPLNVSVRHG